jgi:hypothetical protein
MLRKYLAFEFRLPLMQVVPERSLLFFQSDLKFFFQSLDALS